MAERRCLGLSGLVVKGHGSSDGGAMKNAVRQARIGVAKQIDGEYST